MVACFLGFLRLQRHPQPASFQVRCERNRWMLFVSCNLWRSCSGEGWVGDVLLGEFFEPVFVPIVTLAMVDSLRRRN